MSQLRCDNLLSESAFKAPSVDLVSRTDLVACKPHEFSPHLLAESVSDNVRHDAAKVREHLQNLVDNAFCSLLIPQIAHVDDSHVRRYAPFGRRKS